MVKLYIHVFVIVLLYIHSTSALPVSGTSDTNSNGMLPSGSDDQTTGNTDPASDSSSGSSDSMPSISSSNLQATSFASQSLYSENANFTSTVSQLTMILLLNFTKIAASNALGVAYDKLADPSVSNLSQATFPRDKFIDLSGVDAAVEAAYGQSASAFGTDSSFSRRLKKRQGIFTAIREGLMAIGSKIGISGSRSASAATEGVEVAARSARSDLSMATSVGKTETSAGSMKNIDNVGTAAAGGASKPGFLLANSNTFQLALIGLMGGGLVAQGIGLSEQKATAEKNLKVAQQQLALMYPVQNTSDNAVTALESMKQYVATGIVNTMASLVTTTDLSNLLIFASNGVANFNTSAEFCSLLSKSSDSLRTQFLQGLQNQGFFSYFFSVFSYYMGNAPTVALSTDVRSSVTQVVGLQNINTVLPSLQDEFQQWANNAQSATQVKLTNRIMDAYSTSFCSSSSTSSSNDNLATSSINTDNTPEGTDNSVESNGAIDSTNADDSNDSSSGIDSSNITGPTDFAADSNDSSSGIDSSNTTGPTDFATDSGTTDDTEPTTTTASNSDNSNKVADTVNSDGATEGNNAARSRGITDSIDSADN